MSVRLRCGGQCLICDYPIHFDTYRGCSHKCEYCFTSQIKTKKEIRPLKATKAAKDYIDGKAWNESIFGKKKK